MTWSTEDLEVEHYAKTGDSQNFGVAFYVDGARRYFKMVFAESTVWVWQNHDDSFTVDAFAIDVAKALLAHGAEDGRHVDYRFAHGTPLPVELLGDRCARRRLIRLRGQRPPAMTFWWVPILTFVGGSVVTLAVELIRVLNAREDRRLSAMLRGEDRDAERTTREAQLATDRDDEHRRMQQQTLIELQEILSDFVRASGEAEFHDRQAWRQAGSPADRFPVGLLPEDLSNRLNSLQRRAHILSERVDDEAVRRGVVDLTGHAAQALTARSFDDQESLMTVATERFVALNEIIGAAIRARTPPSAPQGSLVPVASRG